MIVKLQTPIFHPNIAYEGDVCVDILSEWAPATTLLEVAEGLQALMRTPNASSPLNVDASTLMEQDSQLYLDTVLMWTAVHAGGIERPQYLQNKLQTVLDIIPQW
ncbi:NEDD8-conjugating enzyme Ubc12 [Frankliniella fusca]|uniref:NEDD8-conjugating enzyme Ubc12 n=1 Tax=Frankliniella fusca TaxID=407009 RepID=A0AAE1LTV1_9NEOP|nr:NEDD8-conjugating enzyme Ubc12 [Frankliniella fusca]